MAAENFIQGNTPEQFCEMLIEWSSQGSSQPDPLQSDLPGSGYPAPGSMLARVWLYWLYTHLALYWLE